MRVQNIHDYVHTYTYICTVYIYVCYLYRVHPPPPKRTLSHTQTGEMEIRGKAVAGGSASGTNGVTGVEAQVYLCNKTHHTHLQRP